MVTENQRRKMPGENNCGQQRLITLDRSRLLKRHLTQSIPPVKRNQAVFKPQCTVLTAGTTGITGIFDISLRADLPMKRMNA
jgi:hypothetical protein